MPFTPVAASAETSEVQLECLLGWAGRFPLPRRHWAARSRVMTGEAGREESGQMSEPGEETGAELPVIEAMSPRQSRLIAGYDPK